MLVGNISDCDEVSGGDVVDDSCNPIGEIDQCLFLSKLAN